MSVLEEGMPVIIPDAALGGRIGVLLTGTAAPFSRGGGHLTSHEARKGRKVDGSSHRHVGHEDGTSNEENKRRANQHELGKECPPPLAAKWHLAARGQRRHLLFFLLLLLLLLLLLRILCSSRYKPRRILLDTATAHPGRSGRHDWHWRRSTLFHHRNAIGTTVAANCKRGRSRHCFMVFVAARHWNGTHDRHDQRCSRRHG
mmetsp:Transcript_37554/g.63982  ORF Transcript_37554/g.63982 Transcript_37554/m.63982 type:complete len:202 (+) Transcript_37554:332-937(+)